MLPPHELKKNDFTRVMRGYNAAEVDEHLDFVIEKYTELYRANDALEQKLRTVTAQLEALKKDEEAIRGAMISAQRAGSAIVAEANERADVVMRASKTNCDKILADFRESIRYERGQLEALRETVKLFKSKLFSTYQDHIQYIAEIPTEAPDVPVQIPTEDELVRRAIEDIKDDIADGLVRGKGAEGKEDPASYFDGDSAFTARQGEIPEPAEGTEADGFAFPEESDEDDVTVGRRGIGEAFDAEEAPAAEPEPVAAEPTVEEAPAAEAEPAAEEAPADEDTPTVEEILAAVDEPFIDENPTEDDLFVDETPDTALADEFETGFDQVTFDEVMAEADETEEESTPADTGTDDGIMASLARVQRQLRQNEAEALPTDENDDDPYDRDLREFMEAMNNED